MTADLQIDPDPMFVALAEFEAAVETPSVPGEAERWMAEVRTSFDHVRQVWPARRRDHASQLREIANEDPELLQRVDQMQQEDVVIGEHLQELGQGIPALEAVVAGTEPDEAQLKSTMDGFIRNSLSLVIRMRRQEHAIRTWFLEALNRDRGNVD